MLILSSTDTVKAVLTGNVVSQQLRCVASYRDIATSTYTPGPSTVQTNNTTPATVVASPASGVSRVVDFLQIYNEDTGAAQVTITLNLNGTSCTLAKVTLAVGERIEYVDGSGFRVFTVDGAIKTSLNQGANSPITGYTRAVLSSDVVNGNGTANTAADVTGLQVPVVAGQRMWFKFFIRYLANATTTGSRWMVNGPTFDELVLTQQYSLTTTTTTTIEGTTAYDMPTSANASSAATTGNVATMEGIIRPTANGNLIARFASEVSAANITAKAGSFVDYGPC